MRALLSLLTLGVLSGPVAADQGKAKQHLEKAMVAHNEGRYADALVELNIAYTLDAQPALLYAIGQVHVMQGQCAQAITFYQRFLDSKPGPAQAAKASEAIETCKKLQADKPVEQPKQDDLDRPLPTDRPDIPPPPPPLRIISTPAPWYTDYLGDALVGTGILAGVASALFYRAALSDRDRADEVMRYDEYDELLASSARKQKVAIGFAAGAGVLVTAGVISYVVRERKTETRTLIAAPIQQGGMIAWLGRF